MALAHEDGDPSRHDGREPGGRAGVTEFVENRLENREAGIDDAEEGFQAGEEGK